LFSECTCNRRGYKRQFYDELDRAYNLSISKVPQADIVRRFLCEIRRNDILKHNIRNVGVCMKLIAISRLNWSGYRIHTK
jgi:hypothetical protein